MKKYIKSFMQYQNLFFFFLIIFFFENKGMERLSYKHHTKLPSILYAMREKRESAFKELSIPFRHCCNQAIKEITSSNAKEMDLQVPEKIGSLLNNKSHSLSMYADDETFNECMIEAIGDYYNSFTSKSPFRFCYTGYECDLESQFDKQFVYCAIALGTSGALQSLKRQIKENMNIKNYAGQAFLYYCSACSHQFSNISASIYAAHCECWARYGWNQEAKFLLDAQVPLNERYCYTKALHLNRTTPLIVVTDHLNLERVEQLLKLGARASYVDESGKTALDIARNPSYDISKKDQSNIITTLELHTLHEDPQSFFSTLPRTLIEELRIEIKKQKAAESIKAVISYFKNCNVRSRFFIEPS